MGVSPSSRLTFLLCLFLGRCNASHLTTGIKIGESTPTSAIVWVRITKDDSPNVSKKNALILEDPGCKEKCVLPSKEEIFSSDGVVPGKDGEALVRYQVNGSGGGWEETGWKGVDKNDDYATQFVLKGLQPNKKYDILVRTRSDGMNGEEIKGEFRTVPEKEKEEKVVFTAIGCHPSGRDSVGRLGDLEGGSAPGMKIYDTMLQLDHKPDFAVHTGDMIYYDKNVHKNIDLARTIWQKMFSQRNLVNFFSKISTYFMKDDHDTWANDSWPGKEKDSYYKFTFKQGQKVFLEQVPMGESTYRTVRWGKLLQVWFLEGRDFRSPNDAKDGPDKTILGKEQKKWFKQTVLESDAPFKVLFSATPLVGPDKEGKSDNHSNDAFKTEGDELREFVGAQKNLIVIIGDRHWPYVSRDPKTGTREYSIGPAVDWKAEVEKAKIKRDKELHEYFAFHGGFIQGIVKPGNQSGGRNLRSKKKKRDKSKSKKKKKKKKKKDKSKKDKSKDDKSKKDKSKDDKSKDDKSKKDKSKEDKSKDDKSKKEDDKSTDPGKSGKATLTIRIMGVDGEIQYEDVYEE